ncbi:MAG TPA: hypothetical protein VIH57_02730, partial [Bacteroidales bacterium]
PVISIKESEAKQSVYQKKIKDFYRHLRKERPLNHEEKLGFFDLINRTLNLMSYRITQMSLENYSPDILIKISHDSCSMYDFYKAEELVEIGRHAAIEGLKEYLNK